MKNKFTLIALILGIVVGFSVCYLILSPNIKEFASSSKGIIKFPKRKSSAPLPPEVAQEWTTAFRNEAAVRTIHIPISWKFQNSDLITLANINSGGWVRFYAALRPSLGQYEMTLIAVPTTTPTVGVPDGDDDLIDAEDNNLIYNFADPCPTKCSTPNTVLMPSETAKKKYYVFTR